jgi:hypothetical protein
MTPGVTLSSTNGTTEVEIVPAPAASTQRVVNYMSVFNSDTVNHTVILELFDGTTRFTMFQAVIAPNEFIQFSDSGWSVHTSTGAVKQAVGGGLVPISSSWSISVLTADQTNNNAVANTIQTIGSGLAFTANLSTRYSFRAVIYYTAAATTTGSRWAVTASNIVANSLGYMSRYALGTTTETLNHGLTAVNLPAASSASSAVVTPGLNMAFVEGTIQLSVTGTVDFTFASEVASSAIVAKVGSFVEYAAI